MSDSISTGPKGSFQWKTVTALGAATWLVSSQLAGCSPEDGTPADGEDGDSALTQPRGSASAASEEKAAREKAAREKGEGGVTAAADFATNDVAYLTQLGLVRGHSRGRLRAIPAGPSPELSQTHMKHPREEIYAAVVPAFAARGCDDVFADGLTALTQAVTDRAGGGRGWRRSTRPSRREIAHCEQTGGDRRSGGHGRR